MKIKGPSFDVMLEECFDASTLEDYEILREEYHILANSYWIMLGSLTCKSKCCVISNHPFIFQACANPGCPTGGIWSEWTTTDRCPTTCGSCSKAFHTRRCLTAEIECPCIGNDTRYYPCNTLSCVYPAQRTCCIPYVPMIINGSMTCGPLPKDPVVTSCCPAGGLWSNWGGYVRNSENTAFERTRRCLSEEAGCNCTTGNSVNTNKLCPCASFVDTYDTYFKNGTDILYTTSYNRELNLTTCIFWSLLYKTSDACSNWEPYTSTNVIRYWKKDAINYTEYRMADCNDPANQYFRAYCDFKTGYYRFYNTDDEVLGWKQVRILPPG
ncbi:hypothetical protein CRE_16902 [Caenorhabditis remanei]|uniref:Uncharacterized protein n=1 Tax=Caenorhabditis remanei TaxID=31234 RepID=E3MSA9_CAERE|nr:hypothetical protein CRE_16902 [Caenorhabditis remanei]